MLNSPEPSAIFAKRSAMTTLNLFQHATNVETFPAGQVIIEEGQPGDIMYVVQAGEVDILLGGKVIDSAGPGGIIGEMALLSDRPRSATVVAKSECRLAPVDEKQFVYLVHQSPYFAIQVMRVIADRLRRYLEASR
jgi:CRP/FNR family transcriptional regulator, cyclic AMP receptor protein